jgi:O-antigen/teichoic acid export membrane protein
MPSRVVLFRASWTLVDQAVVSLGAFAANIILARALPQSEYGLFAMIFGLLLMLQVVNTTLVFYPHTIRISAAKSDYPGIVWSSMTLSAALTLPLTAVAIAAVTVTGYGHLAPWVAFWFVAWQAQETLRRMLFSEFRHRSAVIGDAVSYLGQALGVGLLLLDGSLTLPKVFAVFGVTSAVAAAIQAFQVRFRPHRLRDPSTLVVDYWRIGRWSLASSVITVMRLNGLFWMIAIVAGTSSVAQLQASFNVVNLVSPILIGLCNLIPAAVARAAGQSVTSAWRETKHYAMFGFVPTAAYYAFVIAAPAIMLTLFYGADSDYADAVTPLRILSAAFVMSYACEMVISFMHGINAARIALVVNLLGSLATFMLAVPLILLTGWVGACWALLVANAVRLGLTAYYLKGVISDGHAARYA